MMASLSQDSSVFSVILHTNHPKPYSIIAVPTIPLISSQFAEFSASISMLLSGSLISFGLGLVYLAESLDFVKEKTGIC